VIILLKSFLIVFLTWGAPLAFSYTIEITEDEIQGKVAAIMPIEKTKFFVTVKLSDPKVELLKAGNRIAIYLNVETSIPRVVKGAGRGTVSGTLIYDEAEAVFYFKEPVLEALEIDRLPPKYTDKVKSIAQAVVVKALAKYPIYKLKDENIKHKLAKSTLKSVEVKDEKLLVELSLF